MKYSHYENYFLHLSTQIPSPLTTYYSVLLFPSPRVFTTSWLIGEKVGYSVRNIFLITDALIMLDYIKIQNIFHKTTSYHRVNCWLIP